MNCRTGGGFGEKGVEIAKVLLEFAKLARIDTEWRVVDGESKLRLLMPKFGFEDLARAGNGVTLVVEETLNPQRHLDVAAAIEALAGTAFVRLELGELALPEAKDVGRDITESGNFADAEV